MRLWVRVNDREFDVVAPAGSDHTRVTLGGLEHDVGLWEGAPGVYRLVIDGVSHDVAVVERGDEFGVAVDGVPFDVLVEDEKSRRFAAAARTSSAAATGDSSVRAPMPGMVVRVDVEEGESVSAGRRLIVLEAMKMENDITSPRAGVVKQIKVGKGQVVEQGQLLVVLE